VAVEREEPESHDESGTGGVSPPRSLAVPGDTLAVSTLAAIRDVGSEVARLVRETATRITRGTPVASLLDALLGSDDRATWAARVVDAEQALALGVQRAAELHARHESVLGELREARDREAALQAELAATLERSRAEREAVARRADELVAAAEIQRAAAAQDAEAARTALAAAQQAVLAQRNELSLARTELVRLTALAEEAQQARERIERDAQALRARVAQSQDQVRKLEVELARVGEERRRAERTTLGEQAEREARWQDELATLRLEHARERDRAQAFADELERQRVEIEARERREQRLQEELQTIAARADTDREETLRRAQEMVQAAEQARSTAYAELEATRGAVSNDRVRLMHIEAEHSKVAQSAAEREAELTAAHAAIARLESARSAMATEVERTRARLTETERELLQTQHELQVLRNQADKLCTAHDDLVEEHARASALLTDARASEAALRQQVDGLREQIRSLESERARLLVLERQQQAAGEKPGPSAKASELETEVKSLRAWTRTLENELAQAVAALEDAEARERRVRETLAANEQSQREYEATLREAQALARAAEQERAAAVAEVETLRASVATTQRAILEAEEETRTARAEAERLAVSHEAVLSEKERLEATVATRRAGGVEAPRAEPAPTRPAPTSPAPAARAPRSSASTAPDASVVAVLDTAAAWPTAGGAAVHVIAPGDDVVGRMGEVGPCRCIVNLAAPGAITAAASLRAAGVAVPLWGAVVLRSGERGLGLGLIDVLTRPIDPDVVRSQCVTIAPKNARILAIGSDSSTFIALRQGLMKAGMSVSIAWDLKQATELMEIVRPHLVVLDLALPGRGAAALVAQLARVEVPPVVVLLPGTADQLAAFSTALEAAVPAEGARTPQNLLRSVIDAKV
jgi:CheY-like chemotaxis protein